MARTASIELLLDNAQALRGAGEVDAALDKVGKSGQSAANQIDDGFKRGFASATAHAKTFLAGALQSFAGNLAASVFGSITSAAKQFASESITAAAASADAQRFLANAVGQVGGSFEAAKASAKGLARELGLTTEQAERALAAVTLRLNGTGIDPIKYLRGVADAAAGAGRSIKDVDITSLVAGINDEPFDKLGLGNPGAIIQAGAKARNKSANDLTEQERTAILAQAVIGQGQKFAGSAAARSGDIGGQLDAFNAQVTDLEASFGKLVARNEGLKLLMETLNTGLTQALDGTTKLDTGLTGLGPTLAGIAQGFVLVGGTIAEVLNLMKTNFDAIGLGFVGIVKVAQFGFAELLRTVRQDFADIIDLLKAGLPANVVSSLGIGGVDTDALRIRAERDADGASGELEAFGKTVRETLGGDLARFGTIYDTTVKALDAASAFGRFSPEKTPGAGGPGASAGAAGGVITPTTPVVRLAPGETMFGSSADGTVLIASEVDGVPTLRSFNPKDPVLRARGGTTIQSAAAKAAEATEKATTATEELTAAIKGGVVAQFTVTAGEATTISNFAPLGKVSPKFSR